MIAYLIAIFAEVAAPYDPNRFTASWVLAPPMRLHFVDSEGQFHLRPFVYGLQSERDMTTLAMVVTPDESKVYPLQFFVKGDPYMFWGQWEWDRHLVGIETDDPEQVLYLLGADELGRDMLSRLIFGARISLSILARALACSRVERSISDFSCAMGWPRLTNWLRSTFSSSMTPCTGLPTSVITMGSTRHS